MSTSPDIHQQTLGQGRATDGGGPAALALVESYRRLADVFHDVLSEQSLDALLERVAGTVGELIPHDDLAFYEADEAAGTLRAVFARGHYADEVLADDPFRFGQGITGWAVQQRTPVLANRADLDPRVRFVEGTPPDPESLIAIPLIARGQIKGALNIYRAGLQEFTRDEFTLAVRFADAAALALDNAQVRAGLELQARTDPLTGLWNHRAFHELLRRELVRTSAERGSAALVMLDIDDFKRVNDVFGHAVGDQVLAEIADHLRAVVRQEDAVCRIGGEEFAIVVPSGDLDAAMSLAERVAERVAGAEIGPVGTMKISIGIALGPQHAANPRELVACAELAMMTAKARGKNRIVVFHEDETERPHSPSGQHEDGRSIAHLKMLHGASTKLTRLIDVEEIGTTVAEELRLLIDYHNCRVFIRDGDDLHLIALRGEFSASLGPSADALATKVGVGITGHVAQTGMPFLTGDAANCGLGEHIAGTEQIEESLLAVPLLHGSAVVGLIVISKLGLDQFDADDVRLLEVLAGHASVSVVNAQLYDAQRREAESARALLDFTREIASLTDMDELVARIAASAARLMVSTRSSLWLAREDTGELECTAVWERDPDRQPQFVQGDRLPPHVADAVGAATEPFVLERETVLELSEGDLSPRLEASLCALSAVAPLSAGTRRGALVASIEKPGDLDDSHRKLLAGVAAQASLALTTASSFERLERTLLSTVEALTNALEAKDELTSTHARWIRDMAVNVGEELGLDQDALKRVELGALFHDIGKIGIPAAILTKPGPLTDEERLLIETHPELGERILAPIDQLEDVRPIVRACHERYDGAGYPDGLERDQIPLEARIIFACDAFHAMTTNRPYREALSVEEARRRLREAAGSQFDPEIVEACLRVLDGRGG